MRQKFLLIIFLLALGLSGYSQNNNLVVFSEKGEKFILVVNGLRQNIEPESSVRVASLDQPLYKVNVIFDNKSLKNVSKTLNFGSFNVEYVFAVKGKKKKRKLKYVSEASIIIETPVQQVVHYNTVVKDTIVTSGVTTTTVGSQQTGTVTTSSNNSSSNGISINVGQGGISLPSVDIGINSGISVGIGNLPAPETISQSSTTVSTTTTSTETSGYSSTGSYSGTTSSSTYSNNNSTSGSSYDGYSSNTYPGSGCYYPMSDYDFRRSKESIAAKSFDDGKMAVAKQVLNNHCMTSGQVKEVMELFSFDKSKLEFAKLAYDRTYDRNNYYMVNDAFTFDSSSRELTSYLSGR